MKSANPLTLSTILDLDETELRRRVAEAAGKHQYFGTMRRGCRCTVCGDLCEDEKHRAVDYIKSLDAILPLVRGLTEKPELNDYLIALYQQVSGATQTKIIRATPLQHAAAFVSFPSPMTEAATKPRLS